MWTPTILAHEPCGQHAEQAAEEVAGLLRRFTGAKTAIHKLTAETPRFTL